MKPLPANNHARLSDTALLRVDLIELRTYLLEHGWVQVGEDDTFLKSPSGGVARIPDHAPDAVHARIVEDIFVDIASDSKLKLAAIVMKFFWPKEV